MAVSGSIPSCVLGNKNVVSEATEFTSVLLWMSVLIFCCRNVSRLSIPLSLFTKTHSFPAATHIQDSYLHLLTTL